MSTLRVNNITDASGGSSSLSVPGAAKAWVNFNGTGTVAIRAQMNVSSITDLGVGLYKVNFTTAFADVGYTAALSVLTDAGLDRNIYCATCTTADSASVTSPSTSSFCFKTINQATTAFDQPYTMVTVFR